MYFFDSTTTVFLFDTAGYFYTIDQFLFFFGLKYFIYYKVSFIHLLLIFDLLIYIFVYFFILLYVYILLFILLAVFLNFLVKLNIFNNILYLLFLIIFSFVSFCFNIFYIPRVYFNNKRFDFQLRLHLFESFKISFNQQYSKFFI